MVNTSITRLAALLVAGCLSSSALAVCAVDDASFTTADGGCKDVNSGLVWSSDPLGLPGPVSAPTAGTVCNAFAATPEAGGFTDWRPPSIGEVQQALANGLASHLDFYYAAGNQPVDSTVRFTSCQVRIRGALLNYFINYSDGSVGYDFQVHRAICVRGLPNDNKCPGHGKKTASLDGQKPLSQMLAGGVLLLPLALVAAVRFVRVGQP